MEKRLMVSTGGKGGTGKSTFAVLLALKLSKQGKRVLLCDCDVECPNDYLLLNKEARDPKQIYQEYPELDEEKCEKCGSCSKVCRQNAIFWVEEKYPVFFHDLCNGCGARGVGVELQEYLAREARRRVSELGLDGARACASKYLQRLLIRNDAG